MINRSFLDTPLGCLCMEVEYEALCRAYFKDEPPAWEPDEHPVLEKASKQFTEYFEGSRRQFNIRMKTSGTEFQQRIWKLLVEIPYGKTETYRSLAARAGDTGAIRAAGTANGKNPIAIIIPCHRVIGSDGSLTGYAGGLARKQWLLDHENAFDGTQLTLFNGIQESY